MRTISILMVLFFITGCQTKSEYSEDAVKNEIQTVFEDFYSKYKGEDFAFTDYYSEDVIRLGPSGKYTEGVENFRNTWRERLEEDSFELLGFGEPRFVISRE